MTVVYNIIEDVDPIIGKSEAEADVLSTKIQKKKIKIKQHTTKEIPFSLPIYFENEHKKNT
jgi:hypothetical protein